MLNYIICCLYRLLVASMQSICLEGLGGERKVDPRLQETTFIQHTFGGRLQSKVCVTLVSWFSLVSLNFTSFLMSFWNFNVHRLSVWIVVMSQKGMRTLWTWRWRFWVGLSHSKMHWLSLLPLKIWMEKICTDVEGMII